ncbi:WD repeat-containing protein 54-like protein, partial [Dinothrombium tinctorium]
EVNILKLAAKSSSNAECRTISVRGTEDNAFIIQAKFVLIQSTALLVILFFNEIQILLLDNLTLQPVLNYSLLEYNVLDDGTDPCAHGIAAFDTSILVGGVDGRIFVFDCFSGAENLNVVFKDILRKHESHIIDIHSDQNHVISCDVSGTIIVWNYCDGKYSVRVKFDPVPSDPCTCICVLNQFVVAALSTGKLRIYGIDKKRLLSEAIAHAKCITALDVCPLNNLR